MVERLGQHATLRRRLIGTACQVVHEIFHIGRRHFGALGCAFGGVGEGRGIGRQQFAHGFGAALGLARYAGQTLRGFNEQLGRFVRPLRCLLGDPDQFIAGALQGGGDVFGARRRLLRDVEQIVALVMQHVARFARPGDGPVRRRYQIFGLLPQFLAGALGLDGHFFGRRRQRQGLLLRVLACVRKVSEISVTRPSASRDG